MTDNTIISLCYVSDKNEKTTRMCRVADYISGRFVPYAYDVSRDFYGEDRDILIGPNNEVLAEIGEIVVVDWYPYMNSDNRWLTSVKRNNEIPWCEVLVFVNVDSPKKLVSSLKSGWQLDTVFDGKHDLILVSRLDNSSGCNAILAKKGTLKCKDNKIWLNEETLKIPLGSIDVRSETGLCQCRYSPNEKRRFLREPGVFIEKSQILVKEPIEVIKEIIQGKITYFDLDVLSRREKQLLRNVVARVNEPTIIDIVCDKLNCSVQEAHNYINQYIEAANLKLDSQSALSIIEKLIESDVDAVLEMKKAVKEEWLQENKTLIEEKKKEIQHYIDVLHSAEEETNKETEKLRKSLQQEENRNNQLAKENEELTASIDNLKKLKNELEQEIQNRLNKAKENMAGLMLDHALMIPAAQEKTPAVGEIKAPKAYSIFFQNAETEKASVYDCHDATQMDWNYLCGDEDMSSGLGLIALAAFACNWPVLVAGEGAETIAGMLSVSVCGHMPLKIRIRDEADLESLAEEIEAQNHQIICVTNGLESGYMVARELMERFRDSRFIFTALHGESLAMEPESLFSVFFPILTDYFYNGRHVREMSTLDCSEELLKLENSEKEKLAFREAKKIVGKWMKDEFISPLLKVRCARMVSSMIMLSKELDLGETVLHSAELELLLTPWLKCLRKKELLQRIIENDTLLDEYKKKDLMSYIGVDGM